MKRTIFTTLLLTIVSLCLGITDIQARTPSIKPRAKCDPAVNTKELIHRTIGANILDFYNRNSSLTGGITTSHRQTLKDIQTTSLINSLKATYTPPPLLGEISTEGSTQSTISRGGELQGSQLQDDELQGGETITPTISGNVSPSPVRVNHVAMSNIPTTKPTHDIPTHPAESSSDDILYLIITIVLFGGLFLLFKMMSFPDKDKNAFKEPVYFREPKPETSQQRWYVSPDGRTSRNMKDLWK